MKKNILLTILILFSTLIFCQTDDEPTENKSNSKYGVGVSLFNLSDLTDNFNYEPKNIIHINIDAIKGIRIEPNFGIFIQEKDKSYAFGFGLFARNSKEKFNLLYGIRSRILMISEKRTYNNFNPTTGNYETSTRTISDKVYTNSAVLGGEYYFIKNFSLGTEVQFKFYNGSSITNTFSTNSSVLILFLNQIFCNSTFTKSTNSLTYS